MSPEERLREAIESFVTRVRQDLDVHGQSLGVDLEASLRDQRTEAQAEHETALEGLKGSLGRAHNEAFGRLLGAVRDLDAATSLKGILEVIAAGARAQAQRYALLLLEGEWLRVWRSAGFPADMGPTDVEVTSDSLIAGVVEGTIEPVAVPSGIATLRRPAFLRPAEGQVGRLVPLAIGGNVVAVLYAEGPSGQTGTPDSQGWVESVEILVRHGAARLENVTSIRTVEALTKPA